MTGHKPICAQERKVVWQGDRSIPPIYPTLENHAATTRSLGSDRQHANPACGFYGGGNYSRRTQAAHEQLLTGSGGDRADRGCRVLVGLRSKETNGGEPNGEGEGSTGYGKGGMGHRLAQKVKESCSFVPARCYCLLA